MSDAAELEREAEAARARLSETADQLKARMSPGQMMDEVLNQFRDGDSGQMLANLRSQARDNPMALALVGSGLAWLMMGSGPAAPRPAAPRPPAPPARAAHLRQGPGAGIPGGGAATSAGGAAGKAWTGSPSAAGEPGETARSAGSDALGGIRDAAGSLRAAGSEALDSLRDHAASAGAAARDLEAAGEERLADLGHQARRTFADVLDREPLVIGAIGLAVGAAIGALLPASALERQHLGSTGEALRDKASTLLDRGVAAAKDAAGEVYETARDEADRQGLTPGDRPLAEKVDAVVRAAGATAGEIAGKHVGTEDDTDKPGGTAPRS